MHLEELANETIIDVFLSLPTVSAAVNLSSTCHRFRHIFASSKRLLILREAADNEYGPLDDIVQLVTHNSSQPAHVHRDVPISKALIGSVVKAGRIAVKWEQMYVYKKWKADFQNRRCLTVDERYVLRRALYRLWLFARAFHNPDQHRTLRASAPAVYDRAALLHNFSTVELAEMLDMHMILRDTISRNICPSNSAIRSKVYKRFPESTGQLLFNPHFNLLPHSWSSLDSDCYHSSANAAIHFRNKYTSSRYHEPGAEGWGDDIMHYYVVEDMLKLDPEQIMWLKENAPYKSQVEGYTRTMGEWFENNGETFVQTMQLVLQQRGGDLEEMKIAIEDGEFGIALATRRDSVV